MISLVFIFLSFLILRKKVTFDLFLETLITWIFLIFFGLELLSTFKALCFSGYVLYWTAIDISIVSYWIINSKNPLKLMRFRLKFCPRLLIILVPSLLVVLLAVFTVPYNWDSMAYHLGRVANWYRNKSVGFYCTNDVRQIASPVLAEYIMLHIYILMKGNDIFVNLVQAFSYVLNAIIIYNIGKKIGFRKRYAYIASFVYMTTPIALAEATTTQTDNFTTVWVLIFIYYLIDFMHIKNKLHFSKNALHKIVLIATCIAFGYLSKPYVLLQIGVFFLGLLFICFCRKDSFKEIAKHFVCAVPILILLLYPSLCRNLKTFKSLSAPETGRRQLVGTVKPRYLCVNFVKNLTFNLPNMYDKNSTEHIYEFTTKFSQLMSVNIDDESISEDGGSFLVQRARNNDVDTAVNPIIIWLLVLSLVFFIVNWKKNSLCRSVISFSSIVSMLIFFLILRWEPFVSRYMISFFSCIAFVFALQLQIFCSFKKKYVKNMAKVLCGIVVIASACEYFAAYSHLSSYVKKEYLTNRYKGYFAQNKNDYEGYSNLAKFVIENDYRNIGTIFWTCAFEYPFIKMVEKNVDRIVPIFVGNYSSVYYDSNFMPDCIVTRHFSTEWPKDSLSINGVEYREIKGFYEKNEAFKVFVK